MKTLKMALLGASFLIGAAGAASAADVYNKGGSYKDAPEAYMPPITWTGFYIGAHLGATFNDDNTYADVYPDEGDPYGVPFGNDDTTWLAGIHVGYNWQKHGPWVFGIEGDVSFGDEIDYLASIRGRLGYAMGSTLVYATGGAAFIGFDDVFGDSQSETGWVAGLGIEHKLRPNVSIGLEGLYYDFGNGETSDIWYGNDPGTLYEDDQNFWTVRARLTYHLGERHEEALK